MAMSAAAAARRRRAPLMALAMVALFAGLWGGLIRLGLSLPSAVTSAAELHGPLMALGFLGTLISLERAVALDRPWAYIAPVAAGTGALAALAGAPGSLGAALVTLAGAVLLAAHIVLQRLQPSAHNAVMGLGAVAWCAAAVLWLTGADVARFAPLMAGFLVLTIVGERLELTRAVQRSVRVRRLLLAAIAVFAGGLVISILAERTGVRIAGVGLFAQAVWLVGYDVARRTVRLGGVTRYMACALLAGYVWLGCAGLLWAVYTALGDGPAYDASLHAVFLGFVMSMVFAHAPVIVPAVLRVTLPFRRGFYVHLVLLHLSLALRLLGGDLAGNTILWQWGGVLGEVAILLFLAVTAHGVVTARSESQRSTRPSKRVKEPSMPTVTSEARVLAEAREQTPAHVLIAGGGVAGLEALLALHDLAGDRVKLTLLSPAPEFVYRPMAIAEPFGRGRAEHHLLADIVPDLGATLARGELAAVDGPGRTAITSTGEHLRYDALLIAVGAGAEPAFRRTLTWTPDTDAELFGGLLRDLEEGYTKQVAFVVPPGVAWALPAYELALMTAWQAWGMGQDDVEVTVYTPEDAPLGMFGPQATAALRHDLEEAGVQAQTGVSVAEDPHIPGRLLMHPGARALEARRVVALPRAVGPRLAGLPCDARGFVLTDRQGKVPGVEAVWAAGDAIAFPVKQGGLATQQADAAAEAIAAAVGAEVEPRPFRPVLRGMMLTGRGKSWMRKEFVAGGDEGAAVRRALWWPPTKIAGRYLSPYLTALHGTDPLADAASRPDGHPVELDLDRELPSAAEAMRQASRPTAQYR